jgi:nucleobase:cation symporter-1, NCS1 family
MAFWLINLAVILKGIEYIRFLQGWSAPVLLAVGLLLLGWAYFAAGGFGPMLSTPSKFRDTGSFLKVLVPALNGAVGFWSTVSLNIPDFTRFAKNQRGQAIGQAIALPLTMTLYSFIGVAVTSATVVIYGSAVWDPVQLLGRFHSPIAVIVSLLAILLATLNVNIGANVVSPANDFSNLWPRKISFKIGGVITCFLGIAMMPWKLLANYDAFVVRWLGGYAALLGSVAGIMICDYFVIHRRQLATNDLYLRGGAYEYSGGFHWRAIAALCIGSGIALMGLVISSVRFLYDYSWFVGFGMAFGIYYMFMASSGDSKRDFKQFLPGKGPSFEGLDLSRDHTPPRKVKL